MYIIRHEVAGYLLFVGRTRQTTQDTASGMRQFRRNCISPTRSVVSHQTAGKYTLTSDDMQLQWSWWYTPHFVRWWYTNVYLATVELSIQWYTPHFVRQWYTKSATWIKKSYPIDTTFFKRIQNPNGFILQNGFKFNE